MCVVSSEARKKEICSSRVSDESRRGRVRERRRREEYIDIVCVAGVLKYFM